MKYLAFLLAASVLVNAQKNKNNGANKNNGGNQNQTGNTGNANNGAANNGNIQDSLTLDPSVICTACTDNGQNPPVDGQSASLTTTNNYINFCDGKTLTDGQQIVGGSCNGVVMGDIIPSSNMPSAKITNPPNFGTFAADTQFTFTMAIKNMVTGNFVNANTNYYGAPQQLQGGNVVGHSHITVQKMDSLTSTTPLDPNVFAFFKGINTAAVNGVLSVDVTDGLPAGVYRFCTMNTSANHTPCMVAIAQHGSLDDCIYATAVAGGGNGGGNNGGNNAAASTTSAAAAASSSVAAGGQQGNNGQQNNGQGRQGQGQGRQGRQRQGGRGRHGRGRHAH